MWYSKDVGWDVAELQLCEQATIRMSRSGRTCTVRNGACCQKWADGTILVPRAPNRLMAQAGAPRIGHIISLWMPATKCKLLTTIRTLRNKSSSATEPFITRVKMSLSEVSKGIILVKLPHFMASDLAVKFLNDNNCFKNWNYYLYWIGELKHDGILCNKPFENQTLGKKGTCIWYNNEDFDYYLPYPHSTTWPCKKEKEISVFVSHERYLEFHKF